MKNGLVGLSLMTIVLGSNPAMAMKPQVQINKVAKQEVLKQIFATISADINEENADVKINELVNELKENNVSVKDMMNFVSLDMSQSQKQELEEVLAPYLGENVEALTQEETLNLMSTLVSTLDTGSHYRSCSYRTANLYSMTALGAGIVAVIALSVGHNAMQNATEEIDAREKLILENESLIEILINEGVNEDSFFILDIKAENKLYEKEIETSERQYDSGKTTLTLGWGALAVSAVTGLRAYTCN